MSSATDWDLGRLISPVAVRDFTAKHWGEAHLLVRRGTESYYDGLATISDLDGVLARSGARPPRVRMVRDGSTVEPDRLVAPGALPVGASVESAIREFQNGATVALHFIQEELPQLATLCEALRLELSCSAQVNVYITPPRSRGLKPHPDNHDVFVLQLAGRKRWTLYTRGAEGEEEPSEDFNLECGDLLYLPRGLIHDAITEDDFSAHLTVGMSPLTVGDLLLMEVARVLGKDERFHSRLPSGLAIDEQSQEMLEARLRGGLRHMAESIDIGAVVADAAAQLVRVQRSFAAGALERAIESFRAEPGHVEAGQVWRLRPGCQIRQLDEGGVSVALNGWQTSFPRSVAQLVENLASPDGHQVAAAGIETEWEVDAVIDRMLADGMVELVRRQPG